MQRFNYKNFDGDRVLGLETRNKIAYVKTSHLIPKDPDKDDPKVLNYKSIISEHLPKNITASDFLKPQDAKYGPEFRTLAEIVVEFALNYPPEREYSLIGNLMRLMCFCDLQLFSYHRFMRSFLLSNRSADEWSKWTLNHDEFVSLIFSAKAQKFHCQNGRSLMLVYSCELINKKNNTFFVPYELTPSILENLIIPFGSKSTSTFLVYKMFQAASLRIGGITNFSADFIREILLSAKTEAEWKQWSGTQRNLMQMTFDTGVVSVLGSDLPLGQSVKKFFARANLETGRKF